FRSTAFQGYCLNNAFIIGSMAVFFIAYYRSLAMKSLFYGTALLAMLSFGARGALAGLTVGFVLILFYELRYFSGMRKANRLGLYLLLLSLVGAAGVYLVTSTPFGERFMQVSYNDDSAEVRMDVYNLLDRVNTQDLLWGMSQSDIDTAMNLEGIGIIENFWIVWIFKYGILMTIALGISVFFFLMQVLKPVRKPVRLIILAVFFMIGSGNNSLSTSTMCLNILVLCGLSVLPGYKSSENILEGSHTPYGYLYSEHDYSTEPE
ncbi:MAG TPA: VpsF family polysaccharide biosynthesis protein, partial [Chitinophagaceae bacterium]|nr:VpsF family polysaccharide biosynthesis protein [Chitinophagaceae bacterium]